VNPKYEELAGLRCYPSLAAIEGEVDCVFVGVPVESGPDVVAEAAACGIPAAVVNATGYSTGGEFGAEQLTRLAEIAPGSGMAVCGPNNIGFVNGHGRVGLWTLMDARFRAGPVALITQSGTASMVLAGDPRELGLAYAITCGDEAVLTAADYLQFVVEDPRVR